MNAPKTPKQPATPGDFAVPQPARPGKISIPRFGAVKAPELLPAQWAQKLAELGINLKNDIVETLLNTITLTPGHAHIKNELGDFSLVFIGFSDVNAGSEIAQVRREGRKDLIELSTFAFLWLLVPGGRRFAVDFTVAADSPRDFFHSDQKTTVQEAHRATETSGAVQHLTFHLDTLSSEGGLIQLYCAKRANEILPGDNQPWKFYRCQIVRLDE